MMCDHIDKMNNIKLLENILSDLQKQEFDPAKKNLEDLVKKRKNHLESLNNEKNNSQEQSSISDGNEDLVDSTINSVSEIEAGTSETSNEHFLVKKRKKSSKGKTDKYKKSKLLENENKIQEISLLNSSADEWLDYFKIAGRNKSVSERMYGFVNAMIDIEILNSILEKIVDDNDKNNQLKNVIKIE